MALRLIEIYHKEGRADDIDFLLKDLPIMETWHDHLGEGDTITKVLLRAENAEPVLAEIESCCLQKEKAYRVVIVPVEATLPRPEEPAPEEAGKAAAGKPPERIMVEELYQKVGGAAHVSRGYVLMIALASFIAALGLLKNDVAVIIGSMVIAPLLSPNKALSLATVLADRDLARRAMLTVGAGVAAALLVAVPMGMLMEVDPSARELALRSDVRHYYIFLALATGAAGAYTITAGVAEALVGVMVAVALLPALAAAGLFAGSGNWVDATGALLLFLVNIVSINLAGVVTFALKGVRPREWWEAEKAAKAVRAAVAAWIVLLLVLALLIIFEQQIKQAVP
jgi:uncharacterized hydrophobic protein (TIGR00341 family)